MHDMNPLVQLIPDSRDGYIKLKLFASSSRWTYALVAFSFFSWRKWGLQPIMDAPSKENKKCKRDTRCKPSNPNQVHLQRGAYQTKPLDGSIKIIFILGLKLIISAKNLGSKGGK
jgi:hypothetical protein